MMTTKSLDDVFSDDLKNPEFIREFLQASWEEGGTEGLLDALQYVARFSPGIAAPANGQPDPSFRSVLSSLQALGVTVRLAPVPG